MTLRPKQRRASSIAPARYLRGRGRYSEAQAFHEAALARVERVLGPLHLDVAQSLYQLGVAHWYQAHYDEARALYERALAIRERELGPDHLDVGRVLNSLAIVDSNQGRYAEAQARYERALAIRERVLGADQPMSPAP